MCKLDHIIDKCKRGDRKAAEQLYRRFSAEMFGICLRFSANRAEAEDNLQDGFIRIFDAIHQYSGKGSFEGWMRRIFINIALEKFRKNRPFQLVDDVTELENEEDIDEDIRVPEEILTEYVEGLPERYRLVFNLYVVDEMQHKDIASMLGITEGTSKSNLARARDILKRKINEYLNHEQ